MWEFLKKFSLVAISLALGLLLAEAAVRYGMYSKAERQMGASALAATRNDIYVKGLLERDNGLCGFADTLQAHPYLGFVHKRVGPCTRPYINNVGLPTTQDIPFEKDPKYFTVLMVGGSVAQHVSTAYYHWLDSELNKKYISPNGRPFRVLGGAFGAWVYPTQLNMVALYGHVADAVIALDGYNEAVNAHGGYAIEEVAPTNYAAIVQRPLPSYLLEYSALFAALRARAYRVPLLARSFLVHRSFEVALRVMARFPNPWGVASAETSDRFFRLPQEWSAEKKDDWNARHYAEYVAMLHGLAEARGLRFAHFQQPVREIGKTLTPQESGYSHMITAELYEKFDEARHALEKKHVPTFSLLHIFDHETGEIYGDHIHCTVEGKHSQGYEKMSDAIAAQVARAWGLKARPQ